MASEFVVFNDSTKQLAVAEPAVKLLRSLSGPICVLALCGRARQGKSFLLNQLLAKLQDAGQAPSVTKKFTVGNTYKPCTKGLWLWSRPIPRTLPGGQPYHLLLLDAEGIDAYDQTADYSNHIFSLALLLSSLLVYNQMGSIDESAVEKLASVCEFARLIAGRADGAASNSASSAELARDLSSPAFVWLLRDFHLQLMEDGRQLTVREYMEQVLQDQPGPSSAVRAKNQVRASIKSLFPDRDCVALVRPMHDEAKLARMDSLPASELRPEFNQGLDALTKLLLSRCHPKALRGSVLTGPALVALAQAYVEVINRGRVPAIATTWQSVVQSECSRALDAASDLYRSRLEAARGPEVSMERLEQVYTEAIKEAEAAFGQQALGEPGERETYLRRLRDMAAAAVGPLRDTKRAQAEARSTEMLAGATRRFMESMRDESADLVAVEAQLHAFLREYAASRPLGGDTYMKAAEFLAGVVLPELRVRVTAARASAASAATRLTELEARLAEVTRRADAQRASLNTAEFTEQQLRRELASVKTEVADAKGQLAAVETRAEGSGRELAALRQELAAVKAEAADAKARLAAAGMNAEGIPRVLATLRQQLAAVRAEAADASARVAASTSTAEGSSRELAALRQQLAAVRAEAADASTRLAATTSTTQENMRELGSLRQQVAAVNSQKQHAEMELSRLRSELAQERVQRTAAEAAVTQASVGRAAAAAQADGVQAAVAAREAELARTRQEVVTLRAAEGQLRQEMADLTARHTVTTATVSTLQQERLMLQTRLEEQTRKLDEQAKQLSDQERRLRAVVDVAAAAGPSVRSGARAAALPSTSGAGGKRGREAAGLTKDRVEVEMDDDDDVMIVEDEPVGAGTATGGERAPRTDRRRVVANTEKRRRGSGAAGSGTAAAGAPRVLPATPEAGANAAAGGGGTGAGGGVADGRAGQQRTPFSIERLVPLRSPPGGGVVRATPPGAGAGGSAAMAIVVTGTATQPPRNLESMKVNDIKSWLTSQGWEADVFELSRTAPTKQDWLALARRKIGESG